MKKRSSILLSGALALVLAACGAAAPKAAIPAQAVNAGAAQASYAAPATAAPAAQTAALSTDSTVAALQNAFQSVYDDVNPSS